MKTFKFTLLCIIFLSVVGTQLMLGIIMNKSLFVGVSLLSIPCFAYIYYLLLKEMSNN